MIYTKPNREANTMERHNCLMMRCFTLSFCDETLSLYDETLSLYDMILCYYMMILWEWNSKLTYIQIIIHVPIFE